MKSDSVPKKIVIVGAGFAGAYVYQYLHQIFHKNKNIELIMVNQRNYFLFTPLLHEAATGLQNPTNVAEPLHKVLCCLSDLHLTQAKKINAKKQILETKNGNIKYDYLVLALGSKTAYYGIPGAREHSLDIKTIADAKKIKNKFIDNFKSATDTTDKKQRAQLLNFVIVGGGPTGVELAAETHEFVHDTLCHMFKHEKLHDYVRITLVDSNNDLLHQFPLSMRQSALKALQKKNIKILLGNSVNRVTEKNIKLDNGKILATNTVIWAAGVEPQEIDFDQKIEKNKRGQLRVNEFLQVIDHKNIFALGDMAEIIDPVTGAPTPAKAQAAVREARVAAYNIFRLIKKRKPKAFYYHHIGDLISLGRWRATGHIKGIGFSGRLTWLLWRLVYLSKLLSWQKKIKVLTNWIIDMFSFRDISRL